MENLDRLRSRIDQIDREMAELFRSRMEVVGQIGAYKAAHCLPIADPLREAEMATRELGGTGGEINGLYGIFQRDVMELSKQYQAMLRRPENALGLDLACGSCDVVMERGCLCRADELMDLRRRVLIVTDEGVPVQYVQAIADRCAAPRILTLADSERCKTLQTISSLLEAMLDHGLTRQDCVVAVGGGAVCDLAGFAASIYERGIDHYNVPTTLLAQLDASVGGKTGVNFGGVKNAVGTFSQPCRVLIDPQVLETLPDRQMASGLAEALKVGVTLDPELFALFEQGEPLRSLDEIIRRAVAQKARVVSADERESGLRRVMNFGHTIGHAIESTHPELLHGECVALGMLPMCGESVRHRLAPIYEKLQLPTCCAVDTEQAAERIAHDKKRVGAEILVVEAPEIGQYVIRPMSLDDLKQRINCIAEGGVTP